MHSLPHSEPWSQPSVVSREFHAAAVAPPILGWDGEWVVFLFLSMAECEL